jgi:hypothetical protein
MTDIPLAAQIQEVSRELGARRRVYPRLVAEGKYPADVLEKRFVAMQAVLATLKRVDQPELALEDLPQRQPELGLEQPREAVERSREPL